MFRIRFTIHEYLFLLKLFHGFLMPRKAIIQHFIISVWNIKEFNSLFS